jgi:hypothetical protein
MFFASCGGGSDTKTDGNDSLNNDTTPKVGEIPFDYPVVEQTTAKAGEFVLTPSRAFIDDAIKAGEGKGTFIFYYNKMVTPGTGESDIAELSGNVKIPNSLIIPIPAGQEVKKGDIVLTWWQSGSGMQRAIVVNDANPKEPVVRYLDLDYDNPAKNDKGVGIGQMEETLKPNSFVKITAEWQPGTAVAYKKDGYYYHAQVINVAGDKVLLKGWGGSMIAIAKADCIAVPVTIDIKVGDAVQVPYIGQYKTGKVKKADPKIGRAWVEVQFGGSPTEAVISYGDIAKNIPL